MATLTQSQQYKCAIDFGGSSTKWAYRSVSGNGGPYVQGKLEGDEHELIWCNPSKIAERVVAFFEHKGCGQIVSLGVSMSGNVSQDGGLLRSDRLDEILRKHGRDPEQVGRNLPLRELLRPRLYPGASVAVVNDAVAAAMGGLLSVYERDKVRDPTEILPPVLIMTLGSYPAISVADREASNNPIHIRTTDFTNAEIMTRDGTFKLHQHGGLTGDTLNQLIDTTPGVGSRDMDDLNAFLSTRSKMEEKGNARKTLRIGRAVAAILPMYSRCFGGAQPSVVCVLGGHSVGWRDGGAVRLTLGAHMEALGLPLVCFPESYEAQSLLHLRGVVACAELLKGRRGEWMKSRVTGRHLPVHGESRTTEGGQHIHMTSDKQMKMKTR